METAEKQKEWTIISLQDWCTSYLKQKEFESPRLNTDLLLCHVLKCKRIDLYSNFEKPLSPVELERFRSLFQRRLNHEPIQYITDEAFFMGLSFYVDKRVLIPRPETEILVEESVTLLKNLETSQKNVLDIGTGSGNIAVSISHLAPGVSVDAIDVSEDALNVARINMKNHLKEEQIHLKKMNILTEGNQLGDAQYDIVVSNPPYVSLKEFQVLPRDVKEHEPNIATTDNGDGLTFYKAISILAKRILKDNGWVLFEVGYDQSEAVKNILRQTGYSHIESILDYDRIERVIKAQKVNP